VCVCLAAEQNRLSQYFYLFIIIIIIISSSSSSSSSSNIIIRNIIIISIIMHCPNTLRCRGFFTPLIINHLSSQETKLLWFHLEDMSQDNMSQDDYNTILLL